MSIPDFQELMLPLLKILEDGKPRKNEECIEILANIFQLSEEDKRTVLKNGRSKFSHRFGWAKTYLKKAKLVESPEKGAVKITPRGLKVLSENLERIDKKYLKKFQEFREFYNRNSRKDSNGESYKSGDKERRGPDFSKELTPQEQIESAIDEINRDLAEELLERIKSNSPEFFEKLVVNLLVKMGYGGNLQDAGRAIGKSGDGGIDGIIREDRLGLDVIYIQAKRWNRGTVGRPEIHRFVGALQDKPVKKGVFITTSSFSKDAREYVEKISDKVVLIDGMTLVQLMIEYNLGVTVKATYEIKELDNDFFEEL